MTYSNFFLITYPSSWGLRAQWCSRVQQWHLDGAGGLNLGPAKLLSNTLTTELPLPLSFHLFILYSFQYIFLILPFFHFSITLKSLYRPFFPCYFLLGTLLFLHLYIPLSLVFKFSSFFIFLSSSTILLLAITSSHELHPNSLSNEQHVQFMWRSLMYTCWRYLCVKNSLFFTLNIIQPPWNRSNVLTPDLWLPWQWCAPFEPIGHACPEQGIGNSQAARVASVHDRRPESESYSIISCNVNRYWCTHWQHDSDVCVCVCVFMDGHRIWRS